jgi:hypothetical protein
LQQTRAFVAPDPVAQLAVAELRGQIEHYCDLGDRVIDQARRRVLRASRFPLGPNPPTCDRHHSEHTRDVLFSQFEEAIMSAVLTYNPVLIDDRNDQPFLTAFVAIFAVLAIALLIAVA